MGRALDLQPAAEEVRALADAEQAKAFRPALFHVESAPAVLDLDLQPAAADMAHPDLGRPHARMLAYIEQQFAYRLKGEGPRVRP